MPLKIQQQACSILSHTKRMAGLFQEKICVVLRKAFFKFRLIRRTNKRTVRRAITNLNCFVRQAIALFWHRFYWIQFFCCRWYSQRRFFITLSILFVLAASSFIFSPILQLILEPSFVSEQSFSAFRTLIVTLGGALIGAAAITFSFVMFALQVNVERLPHGLFQRFSSDSRLLGTFASIFILAICVLVTSLIPDGSWVAVVSLITFWAVLLILTLFLYGYKRALSLINPSHQLRLLVKAARKEMRKWEQRAIRVAPLLEQPEAKKPTVSGMFQSSHDLSRTAYFQINPHWTRGVSQAILYAVSYARRAAENRDYEISALSLDAVIAINSAYIRAKGKTFFSTHLLFDNPLARDGFISDTLEHLRQNVQIGISRGDERQIEQNLQTLATLVKIYLEIDYSNVLSEKEHARLAAGYLEQAIQAIVPHNMPDVIMNGLRLLGQSGLLFLAYDKPNDMVPLVEKIGSLSCMGVVNEKYRPILLTGMEQLSKLTFNLIQQKGLSDINFAAGRLKQTVNLVASLFLEIPESAGAFRFHGAYLESYYSGTSHTTLQSWLTDLVNVLIQTDAENKDAQTVIYHIEQWSEDLYQYAKEIFLKAVERRAQFALDMVFWIGHITKLLFAVSSAASCPDHIRRKIKNHALWLISVFSWVPDDKETITILGNFHITETIFEAALDAHRYVYAEEFDEIFGLLMAWAFRAGKHQTGWGTLEEALYGLSTLAIVRDDHQTAAKFKQSVQEKLLAQSAPNQEIRDHSAREIRRYIGTSYRSSLNRIENAMSHIAPEKLHPLLEEIANLLSPNTAGEPIHFGLV